MTKKRNQNSYIHLTLLTLLVGSLICSYLLYANKIDASHEESISTPSSSPTTSSDAQVDEVISTTSSLSIPYAKQSIVDTLQVDNETGFTSGWSIQATDANISATQDYIHSSLQVINSGSSLDAASYYRVGIPLEQGCTYTITFNATSTIDRSIQLVLSNEDTGEVYASQDYNLTSNESMYSLVFKYDNTKIWNAKISFLIGKTNNLDSSTEHTIDLSNIRIVADYAATAVRVNQVGYLKDYEKRCTFIYDAGDFFDVVNAETNAVVYTGAILHKNQYIKSGELNCYGDFSSFIETGTYYIRSQIGIISDSFNIIDSTSSDFRNSLLRMLSLQRCGTSLDSSWASELSHDICHNKEATFYGTEKTKDVSGGWHDAGDYGRYVKTGTKAVTDLLLSYLYNQNYYDDHTNTIDSNNNQNDLLDEARYELEWLLKMQDDNGGVYNTVITPNMSNVVSPEEDTQDLYVLFIETSSTADFAGTMALSYITFKDIDEDFASTCLEAAKNADSYLAKTENEEHDNPTEFNGGNYRDDSDLDGRFYAKMALYVATNDTTYLNDAKALYDNDSTVSTGVTWKNNGGFGRYLFLTHEQSKVDDSDFYEIMLTSLKDEADSIVNMANDNGYNISIYEFPWGSNSDLINNGIILSMAYDMTGNTEYEQLSYEQMSYILGKNPLNMCFITGYGINSPQNIHSRLSKAKNALMIGALVGGPDSYREDIVSSTIDSSVPDAKVYADDYECYTTNEITIYWNSALIHLLSRLEK